ncbi:F-box domain-containing protein [Cryptosporidium muris RN66]|uniref:F-box domain-containing protein n=1 Tax=Cryptosporidium muris (strain RN66) TaxID=441375 RepID=B6AAZ8_CRYMR|nr:F-box domain-containing protein [Cryptosporidium muris RN66]EEA05550.1 F-box domain-containing protein [Cryptosporidium muris RN66]|eukprot:XP_002139899.1 F-box domain-containing protein [Cryptosporidium muris RN66]
MINKEINFSNIPSDILGHIFAYSGFKSFLRCQETCQNLLHSCSGLKTVWTYFGIKRGIIEDGFCDREMFIERALEIFRWKNKIPIHIWNYPVLDSTQRFGTSTKESGSIFTKDNVWQNIQNLIPRGCSFSIPTIHIIKGLMYNIEYPIESFYTSNSNSTVRLEYKSIGFSKVNVISWCRCSKKSEIQYILVIGRDIDSERCKVHENKSSNSHNASNNFLLRSDSPNFIERSYLLKLWQFNNSLIEDGTIKISTSFSIGDHGEIIAVDSLEWNNAIFFGVVTNYGGVYLISLPLDSKHKLSSCNVTQYNINEQRDLSKSSIQLFAKSIQGESKLKVWIASCLSNYGSKLNFISIITNSSNFMLCEYIKTILSNDMRTLGCCMAPSVGIFFIWSAYPRCFTTYFTVNIKLYHDLFNRDNINMNNSGTNNVNSSHNPSFDHSELCYLSTSSFSNSVNPLNEITNSYSLVPKLAKVLYEDKSSHTATFCVTLGRDLLLRRAYWIYNENNTSIECYVIDLCQFKGHNHEIYSLSFDGNRRIATLDIGNYLVVWDLFYQKKLFGCFIEDDVFGYASDDEEDYSDEFEDEYDDGIDLHISKKSRIKAKGKKLKAKAKHQIYNKSQGPNLQCRNILNLYITSEMIAFWSPIKQRWYQLIFGTGK